LQGAVDVDSWSVGKHLLLFILLAVIASIPIARHAQATEAEESTGADGITGAPVVLSISPEKSEFECTVFGFWFMRVKVRMWANDGRFETVFSKMSGNSQGLMTIDPDNLKTVDDALAKRIKANYLETERYPEISFTLTDLEGECHGLLAGGEGRFKATGILRLHGVEKEIVLHPLVSLNDDFIEFRGETVVRMTDFGIQIPSFLFILAQDEVSIHYKVAWDFSRHLKKNTLGAIRQGTPYPRTRQQIH
jgi:polyisoprenoid-binding protein YceI